MLVEGLLLWSKVVAVNLNEDRHMKYYYLIGWGTRISQTNTFLGSDFVFHFTFFCFLSDPAGLPVLIVTITLASASGKYSADGYCWLSVQDGVIWGFAGPVIFIIMVRKFKTHSLWRQNSSSRQILQHLIFNEQSAHNLYYFQLFKSLNKSLAFVCTCVGPI